MSADYDLNKAVNDELKAAMQKTIDVGTAAFIEKGATPELAEKMATFFACGLMNNMAQANWRGPE